MKFAGCDYDSHRIDVVLVDLDTHAADWRRYPLTGPLLAGDAFDRARRVRDALPARGSWADEGVVQIVIEDPKSVQFRAAVSLARVQGAILACLPRDVSVLELTPSEWKGALGLKRGGKREQTKAEVRAFALDQLGAPQEWPQDPCDALCIAHAAIRLGERAAA